MSQQPPEQGPQGPDDKPNSAQPDGSPQQPGTPPPPGPGQQEPPQAPPAAPQQPPTYGAAGQPPSAYPSPEQGGFQTPPPPGPGQSGQYGQPGPGYGGPPPAPGVNPGQYGQGGYGAGSAQQFNFGAVLGYAWKTVIQNPVVWILGTVLVVIVSLLVSLLNPGAQAVFDAANGSFNVAATQSFTAMGLIAGILSALVLGFVQAVAQNAGLRETAGNKPSFGDVFQVPNMQNALIWAVIWGVGSGVVNLIPVLGPLVVLVASIALIFTMSAIIDRGVSWMDGLKTSLQLVQQNVGPTLLLVVLLIVLGIATVITCGLGVFLTAPMGVVAITYTYRSLSGQPIAPKV
ncbi:hypothetical protein [Ruania halotolerans]|uniref:hypothetical protein n=1 Tax=Ruania halotolerans TaxID=2897773 RepID=UPI001E3C7666|nr:hypothetical protein [Ruania halotolerans]UFU04941.1 hypothetical protein LQF10_10655 [Ruania halotolerans]